MSAEKIISDWEKRVFKPVYWLEGEEEYFIDKVMHYAEHKILSEAEAGFNLTVFYGRDASWADVINACRRYPMFAERQVVLLKEAQQMREIDKLEPYIDAPSSSTVFVVSYKDKKVDGRSKLAKLLKEKGVMLTTKRMYEDKVPQWTHEMVKGKGYAISEKAARLLVDHTGNDLSRIENEVEKILVNLGKKKTITEEDIEAFIGISKDYNVFELQAAIATRDLPKALRIIQYFGANPKAGPIQLVLPSLYGYFSKVFMIHGLNTRDEKVIAASASIPPFFVKDYLVAARNFDYQGTERILLLLHEYNLKSVGVHDAGTEDASLLKEMVVKMMQP